MLPLLTSMLKAAEENFAAVGGILVALSLIFKKVRSGWAWLLRWVSAPYRRRCEKLDLILQKVEFIERELQYNGGSTLRDMVGSLAMRQRMQFWKSRSPSIELDRDACVKGVSETACRLFAVADPAELYVRNWLGFVEAGRVDDFLHSFAESVRFRSQMKFDFAMRDANRKPLGVWELHLSPVTPEGASHPVYSGYFRPVDDVAKAQAVGL